MCIDPPLPFEQPSRRPGQLGHDGLGVHADGERVAVIAIGGDHLVAGLERHLHADDDGLLADVEVAEAADVPHAVELPGLLLEAADEQHAAVGVELLVAGEAGARRLRCARWCGDRLPPRRQLPSGREDFR